ncbi:TetR/AcrR family transcriptional regulator [Actinospica durhamensis]|uniref:TetR/AcrR family transcriptional regulator n=1 Tax=Actinospica durhamensis TaxID=1508375 RepID=A0A941ISC8_9ACTN|nr:TetR/AcrR family transcriptional regulator [Actinospica durhamensis]
MESRSEPGPQAAPAARPRPLRADAARNRAKVLDAARAAFAAEGLAVPLDEIARRAGVGAGTVYRHFPTKEALFEAVVADRLDALAAGAEAVLDAHDAGAAFFDFFISMVEDADGKKDLAEALAASGVGLSPQTLASAARLQARLGALLDRALAAGAVRDGVSVADLHALAVGALAAEARAAAEAGYVQGRLTRLICDGLLPPGDR